METLIALLAFIVFAWLASAPLTNMFWGAAPWDKKGAEKNIEKFIKNLFK